MSAAAWSEYSLGRSTLSMQDCQWYGLCMPWLQFYSQFDILLAASEDFEV
jgi:hypothetical protein